MPKLQIKPGPYARLQKLAAGNGSHANIGMVIGNTDPAAIQFYLDHMKTTDKALWKTWGSKWKAAPPEEDEDLVDPTAEDDDEPAGEATAGLTELFAEDPDLEMPLPPAKKETRPAATDVPAKVLMDGVAYPAQFKFRGPDGITTDLEVFSKNPKWGFILGHPTPADKRTILLSGGELEVDLLALRRDPDGMTEFMGRKYSNSKLITALELQDGD